MRGISSGRGLINNLLAEEMKGDFFGHGPREWWSPGGYPIGLWG
jgi:hypothetical protein